ncbi:uracil-DNA glycosylase family protein [uncultured Microscilla sp.]|uniref:uracil-DNA glycosylase family protein n=1 Tax=uncultured Microscilla sp. TaxID=432653 RepID=UPI0026319AC1|nr:uracil-DNA glycosylase family protein [uncultured Microscilla sp.]
MPELDHLLAEIRTCKVCEENLPLGAHPVVSAQTSAKIMIIGQAPGTKVHASGVPWDDASGQRLREWMGVDKEIFYDTSKIAIMPMGFCYPGRGKGGDLPPRVECAPLWHKRLLEQLPDLVLILLIGQYAQKHYLGKQRKKNLTETVRAYHEYQPDYFPLVHPSPRNLMWQRKNLWFEDEVVPALQAVVKKLLTDM